MDINLAGLIRFLLAHFRDVPLLKEYLEICKYDCYFALFMKQYAHVLNNLSPWIIAVFNLIFQLSILTFTQLWEECLWWST